MPNPVSDRPLTISVPEDLKISRAVFSDLNGKIILTCRLSAGLNSVTVNFPRGLYLLNISGEDVNYTTKIVVN
jgi:hypothetical protein